MDEALSALAREGTTIIEEEEGEISGSGDKEQPSSNAWSSLQASSARHISSVSSTLHVRNNLHEHTPSLRPNYSEIKCIIGDTFATNGPASGT